MLRRTEPASLIGARLRCPSISSFAPSETTVPRGSEAWGNLQGVGGILHTWGGLLAIPLTWILLAR
jgi:hypothetical protein